MKKALSRRPESYRLQAGCHNCAHVFIMSEYDEGPSFYCKKTCRTRPKCGSVVMNESFGDVLKSRGIKQTVRNKGRYMAEYGKLMNKWRKWAQEHEVADSGICKEYAKKQNRESPVNNR